MALISPELAVMSVGMSCQPAHQLRTHVDSLRLISGQPLQVHSTPWDWTICGPAGVAAMVRDGVTFPRDPRELEARAKPYWPARSCFFWHVKGAITDHAAGLARALECEAQLEHVAAARRRVFILANTQNNLEAKRRDQGGFNIPFTPAAVDDLEAALVARFGPSELHVVSYGSRHALGGRRKVWELKPDRSQWQGDPHQWAHLLGKLVR